MLVELHSSSQSNSILDNNVFVYLLINAHRFNSPLLHFFFTHTHKHDKAETLSLQICVCVFASPQLVTSGPSSPDRVCTGTSTASDILPWLATGEFPPCCHARGHFSRVWNYNTNLLNYWITVMQIPVCSRCIIRWHISHFPWFLPAVSSKFWRHWASQWTFPFPRNFPVLLCRLFWDSSLYLSVKFSLSFHSSCHVFCWESCCSHLLHPADIWMFPQ